MKRLGPLAILALACACARPAVAVAPPPSTPAPPAVSPVADRLVVAVDPRVELMSILCALAGFPEYQGASASPYTRAVVQHFGAYATHPAVAATASLRSGHGIGYDAPIRLAVHLDRATFAPLVSLAGPPDELGPTWRGVAMAAYLEHVKSFASDTKFAAWLESLQSTLAPIEAEYRSFLSSRPILPWFDEVFGARNASYRVAPGLLTGPMAYGAHVVRGDRSEEVLQLIYLENPDAEGMPHLTRRTLEFLVHELAHTYVNPVLEAHASELGPVAQPLFERTAKAMAQQHYTTLPIFVNESVVRAVTILFLRDRSTADHVAASLAEQDALSFGWTKTLADDLESARTRAGGRLDPDTLVATTRATFVRWAASH